jgi:hypothetical protein
LVAGFAGYWLDRGNHHLDHWLSGRRDRARNKDKNAPDKTPKISPLGPLYQACSVRFRQQSAQQIRPGVCSACRGVAVSGLQVIRQLGVRLPSALLEQTGIESPSFAVHSDVQICSSFPLAWLLLSSINEKTQARHSLLTRRLAARPLLVSVDPTPAELRLVD